MVKIALRSRLLKVTPALGVLLVMGGALPRAAGAAAPCAPAATAQKDVIAAVQGLFDALRADDAQLLQQVTTPDFYAYDNGLRTTGPGILELLEKAKASGKHYEWSITQAEPHATCNLAWLTYVNEGAVQDASGRQPMTWLESAVLEYSNGHWRVRFAQSSRVAKAAPNG